MRALMLSMPKARGFQSLEEGAAVVNVGDLARLFPDGSTVTPKLVVKRGLVRTAAHGIKVLGAGDIGIKLTLKDLAVSASAKAKIEKAGGTVA
jgi:large subunit ribosomal protein L15